MDISHGEPDFVLFSDTSLTGCGCSCEHGRTGGHRDSTEVAVRINAFALKAGLFALQVFANDKCSLHMRLMMDNTTAVARINKMGTSYSDTCNSVTKQIWELCIARNLWISAAYVPGIENAAADNESRKKTKKKQLRRRMETESRHSGTGTGYHRHLTWGGFICCSH